MASTVHSTPPAAPSFPALRREPWSKGAYYAGLTFAHGVLRPLTALLALTGAWPRVMSRGMAQAMAEAAARYVPQPHDVLVCSYFKTGTNWTMQIAAQIAHRGGAEFAHIHDVVPWLELPEKYRFAVPLTDERVSRTSPTGLRVVKTHIALDDLRYDPRTKYICVVRDPKDVFVSSYHFVRSTMLGPLMPPLAAWLDLFLSDDAFCGPWARHLNAAWQARDRANVLFLTYEDMKADLAGAVGRIAQVMGVELTPAELAAVVDRSSYGHMKSIGYKFDTMGLSPPWVRPQGSMVRRGERGSASELLGESEQRRIDDHCRAQLRALGSDFPYDERFGRRYPA
jgi:hypothetical protein